MFVNTYKAGLRSPDEWATPKNLTTSDIIRLKWHRQAYIGCWMEFLHKLHAEHKDRLVCSLTYSCTLKRDSSIESDFLLFSFLGRKYRRKKMKEKMMKTMEILHNWFFFLLLLLNMRLLPIENFRPGSQNADGFLVCVLRLENGCALVPRPHTQRLACHKHASWKIQFTNRHLIAQ